MSQERSPLPLTGVKVIELGQLIAGPFAGKTLADFGAEVIKIEPPGEGDPLRKWRVIEEIATRDGLELKVPEVVPKLSETPGTIRTTAPRLGEDAEAILRRLGYTTEQIAALRADKVI